MSEKSFSDLSSKLREKRQKEVPEEAPRNFEAIYALRARVLGILIRDARLAANVPPSIVAANVGVDEVTLQAWEFGEDMPTLPQLELLAFTLDVPVSHFFGTQMLPDDKKRTPDIAPSAYYALRDRVIGVKVALARQQLNMSMMCWLRPSAFRQRPSPPMNSARRSHFRCLPRLRLPCGSRSVTSWKILVN